ncbi:MAG: histidine phosphatase family protein [Rhodobiaceae bacterium]
MGRFIREKGLLPDLVIVSTAARTRETFELASRDWPDIPVLFLDSIYEASATTVMAAIEAHGGDYERVMVIGHNPGLVVLLHNLVDSPPSGLNMSYFPTSCVADIGFDVPHIRDIQPESGRLLSFIRVRELS